MDLAKKNVFITGASHGLGLKLSSLFSRRGYHVFATSRDIGRLISSFKAKELDWTNCFQHDFASDDLKKLKDLIEQLPPQRAIIHNASLYTEHRLEETLPQEFSDYGCFWASNLQLAQSGAQKLKENGGGRIIWISSNVGIQGQINLEYAAYSCYKASLTSINELMQKTFVSSGVSSTIFYLGTMREDDLAAKLGVLKISDAAEKICAIADTDLKKQVLSEVLLVN